MAALPQPRFTVPRTLGRLHAEARLRPSALAGFGVAPAALSTALARLCGDNRYAPANIMFRHHTYGCLLIIAIRLSESKVKIKIRP